MATIPEHMKAKNQFSQKPTLTFKSFHMQKIVLSALFFFWIIQSACVTSLNPLVTYDRAITDEKLSGTWKKSDGQEFLIQPVLKSDFYKHHQDKDDIKKESK